MKMTFEDYINNPMGKGSAVMSTAHREVMRMQYKKKFDNILLREKGKIDFRLFRNTKSNTYWVYVKIPSELCKNFYYDTIVKFYADETVKGGGKDLFKYYSEFYSNDPAFVYTYAYVFSHNDLFIKELSSKMSKEALRKSPTEKNPSESVGYVKSLYFVYLLMQNRNLNKVNIFEEQCEELNPVFFMTNVMPADRKIAEREEAGRGVSQRKKVVLDTKMARKVTKMTGDKLTDRAADRLAIKTTKKVKNISGVSEVKTTKKTKRK